jgi:hypothetical protein
LGCFCAKTELLPFVPFDNLGFSNPGVPILEDLLGLDATWTPDDLHENKRILMIIRENKNFILK